MDLDHLDQAMRGLVVEIQLHELQDLVLVSIEQPSLYCLPGVLGKERGQDVGSDWIIPGLMMTWVVRFDICF